MAKIDSYVQPRKLYRYRSLKDFTREVAAIENCHLYCANFTDLNDPMEGLFRSSLGLEESADYKQIREEIIEKKSEMRMCCFSEIHNHELMWAHYADQFKGICIAYSFSMLLTQLPKNISFVRMFYDETEPIIPKNDKTSSKKLNDLAKMVLSHKNFRWLYEREWRMFALKNEVRYHGTACVTDVYLGSRISADDREELTKQLKRLNIKVHDMIIKKYAIDFEENKPQALPLPQVHAISVV